MIMSELVRQCPVCWRFLQLWSSNWVSSKSHQFHANNGADHKCKRLLWFKSSHMQLPNEFGNNLFNKFKIDRSLESIHRNDLLKSRILFFITTGKEQNPPSTAIGPPGQCRRTQVWCRGAAGPVPLPGTSAVPQGPARNRHLRHSTHGETKHICSYLLSESAYCQIFSSGWWGDHVTETCCFLVLIHPPSKLGVL